MEKLLPARHRRELIQTRQQLFTTSSLTPQFSSAAAQVSSVLLTGWLVGPSEVCDVDPAVLDPALRQGWGNEPSGWVPGFALGGGVSPTCAGLDPYAMSGTDVGYEDTRRWRKELGAGQVLSDYRSARRCPVLMWRMVVQGVQIERCRVLELSGCASVCANVCKAPTQHFFTHVSHAGLGALGACVGLEGGRA
eukprot:1952706-Rhodomonas_salina.6